MNELHMHPVVMEHMMKQNYESRLREAEMRRLLKHIPSSRSGLQHRVARQLGHLLVQLGSRLQEKQRPVL